MPLKTILAEQGVGRSDARNFRRAARLVIVFTGLIVLVLAGAATIAALNGRNESLDAARRNTAALAQSLAEHAARTVAEADQALRVVTESLDDGAPRRGTTHLLLARLSDELPQVRSMLVLDGSGRSIADARVQPPRPFNGADRDYFRAQYDASADRLFIGLPRRGALSGTWTISLSRRITGADNGFEGVAVAALDPTYFNQFFARLIEPGASIALIRDDGRLLLREPIREDLLGRDLTPLMDFAAAAASGPSQMVGADGIVRIVAVRKIDRQPLYVTVALPVDIALRNWRERSVWLAAGTALACLAIIALGGLLLRELARLNRRDAALAYATALMDAMLGAVGQGIAITDRRGRIVLANEQAADLSGTPPDLMRAGTPFMMTQPPATDGRSATAPAQLIHLPDGRKTAVRHDAMADGNTVTIFTDVTAEKAAEATLTRLAMLDPLTELPNRRSFLETAERELNRMRRHAGRACVAILDIDHFKQVNDAHGHQAGDVILRALADLWSDMLRSSDTLARYGGEEFIVLMPETEPGVAIRLLERLRQATSARHLGAGPEDMRVTVSIGLAGLAPDGHIEDAIEAADAALYRAKDEGRNRVCAAPARDVPRRRLG